MCVLCSLSRARALSLSRSLSLACSLALSTNPRRSLRHQVYHGASVSHGVRVSASPGLIVSPATATVQFQQRASFELRPQKAPSSDVSVAVTIIATDPPTGSLIPTLVATVSPSTFLLFRKDGLSANSRREVTVTCLGPAGTVRVLFEGSSPSAQPFSDEERTSNYDEMRHAAVTVKCLPGFALAQGAAQPAAVAQPSLLTLDPLNSPRGSATVTLALLEVPTERVTVVLTVNDLTLVQYTARIYFEALEQQQTRSINLVHLGGFLGGTAVISLAASGGNYQDAVLREALVVPVNAPGLLLSTKRMRVAPNGFSTFNFHLDTPPSSAAVVTAASSDPLVVTVSDPITVTDTALYAVRVTHVSSGTATVSISLAASPGSTYGNVSVGPEVAVEVEATRHGFRVSSSQTTLAHGSQQTISIAPDTRLDSRVQLSLTVVPAGVASVSPSSIFFEPASTFATAAHSFTLTWSGPGSAHIELRAKGGLYQGFVSTSLLNITALPPLPATPAGLAAAARHGAEILLTVSPASSLPGLAPARYRVQVSESSAFADVAATASIAVPETTVSVGPLRKGACYYYRAASVNEAGSSGYRVSSGCIRALDAPGAVSALRATAVTEDKALVQWDPPTDSGDGTAVGVTILGYLVESMINGSALVDETFEVAAPRTTVMLPVRPSNIYTLRVSALSEVIVPKADAHTASLYFSYQGVPVDYYVPLEFAVSTSSILDKVGRTSSFTVAPMSAPYVDAVVRIKSNRPSSATAITSQVIFRKGITTAQTIVVEHRQRGDANLTFEIEGFNYRGLQEAVVSVETVSLASPGQDDEL